MTSYISTFARCSMTSANSLIAYDVIDDVIIKKMMIVHAIFVQYLVFDWFRDIPYKDSKLSVSSLTSSYRK